MRDEAENENPGALAGATGAECRDWLSRLDSKLEEIDNASRVILALADCAPHARLGLVEMLHEVLRAGAPIPAFMGVMSEARLWASWASRAELKAYAAASVERLDPQDRAALIGWAGEVAA